MFALLHGYMGFMGRSDMNQELKPCAHCGSDDIRVKEMDHFDNNIQIVMCWGCGISTQYMPNNKAIERWNQRV